MKYLYIIKKPENDLQKNLNILESLENDHFASMFVKLNLKYTGIRRQGIYRVRHSNSLLKACNPFYIKSLKPLLKMKL